jgi:hypothetical protein
VHGGDKINHIRFNWKNEAVENEIGYPDWIR